MKLDKQDIVSIYNRIKNLAFLAFNAREFNKCLNYIEISAAIASKFSWTFKDDDYEELIKQLSKCIIKPVENYTSNINRYVFFDSFSYDNKGLSQQYIRALISQSVNFLYITESSAHNYYSVQIFTEITKYEKADIFEVPRDIPKLKKIEIIFEQIISYGASKIFMHLSPNAVCPLVAISALPNTIIKYQINLTDHAFWLGTKCLDYSFEFRPYGCTISQKKRGIDASRILLLPFYPIASEIEFNGFPKECKGKVIIFSGGAYPKILSEDQLFLNLVKQLLNRNKDAIFLYAGSGDSIQIEKFIRNNDLSKRFILLGNRSDINEVFKNCDIYMSTYPLGGGLMAQFAAMNGKPIISYSTIDKIHSWPEETISQWKKIKITYTNIDEFLSFSQLLISDKKYRTSIGEEFRECVISIESFNKTFIQTIMENSNQIPYENEEINVNFLFNNQINVENVNNELKIFILKSFKLWTIKISPKIFFWAIIYLFRTGFWAKVFRRLKIL
ncbi:glycosyltransferase family 4 protein [Petrimonas sp.]|uniref:glycosyltransferase family 4 protein n=1 Tax=Petrimonas sp. TaxID=2023866 RepID=UPI002FCAEEFF